jgi:hypothetical protein
MPARHLVAALALALTSACVGQSSYFAWGGYSDTLYGHYKTPADREAWVTGLKRAILQAEERGAKMPPGIYAEYGYALFEEGDSSQAIVYFKKEQALWPESKILMDKMIRNANQRGSQPTSPAQGPAGAVEKS